MRRAVEYCGGGIRRRHRVVYVEDDERLARMTTQYLTSHQIDVHVVLAANQALPKCCRGNPKSGCSN